MIKFSAGVVVGAFGATMVVFIVGLYQVLHPDRKVTLKVEVDQ